MINAKVLAVTGTSPLSVADLKSYLLVTHTHQDDEIQTLLDSAISMSEEVLGYHVVGKQIKERFKSFPRNYRMPLGFGAVSTVDEILYYDDTEASQTFDVANVVVDDFTEEGALELLPSSEWPTGLSRRTYPIEITYTTSDHPSGFIKLCIKKAIADSYVRREDRIDIRTPQVLSKLLRMIKLYKF